MKVTLLGTGDAIGTPKIGCKCPACADALRGGRSRRMRFSVLLESDEDEGRVLVDTSPDLRWQLLKKDIASVDGVIWTHAHYDHYAGFGDFHRVQSHVDVYALKGTMDYILNYLYFLKPVRHDVVAYEPFEIAGMEFTLFKVNHPPTETAGVLVTNGQKRLVITSDTNLDIPAQSLDLMKNADLDAGRCHHATRLQHQQAYECRGGGDPGKAPGDKGSAAHSLEPPLSASRDGTKAMADWS